MPVITITKFSVDRLETIRQLLWPKLEESKKNKGFSPGARALLLALHHSSGCKGQTCTLDLSNRVSAANAVMAVDVPSFLYTVYKAALQFLGVPPADEASLGPKIIQELIDNLLLDIMQNTTTKVRCCVPMSTRTDMDNGVQNILSRACALMEETNAGHPRYDTIQQLCATPAIPLPPATIEKPGQDSWVPGCSPIDEPQPEAPPHQKSSASAGTQGGRTDAAEAPSDAAASSDEDKETNPWVNAGDLNTLKLRLSYFSKASKAEKNPERLQRILDMMANIKEAMTKMEASGSDKKQQETGGVQGGRLGSLRSPPMQSAPPGKGHSGNPFSNPSDTRTLQLRHLYLSKLAKNEKDAKKKEKIHRAMAEVKVAIERAKVIGRQQRMQQEKDCQQLSSPGTSGPSAGTELVLTADSILPPADAENFLAAESVALETGYPSPGQVQADVSPLLLPAISMVPIAAVPLMSLDSRLPAMAGSLQQPPQATSARTPVEATGVEGDQGAASDDSSSEDEDIQVPPSRNRPVAPFPSSCLADPFSPSLPPYQATGENKENPPAEEDQADAVDESEEESDDDSEDDSESEKEVEVMSPSSSGFGSVISVPPPAKRPRGPPPKNPQGPSRPQGRPPKSPQGPPKPRGRPPKAVQKLSQGPPRPRGRPPKNPQEPPRRRGRPPKAASTATDSPQSPAGGKGLM